MVLEAELWLELRRFRSLRQSGATFSEIARETGLNWRTGWASGLRVTPHTLRRSRAMHLVQAGVNLIYIRDLLGHADVSTTEIYAR